MEQGKTLPWAYNDPEISEFSLSGNFLASAEAVADEYRIRTPFKPEYRLDVAIIGPKLVNKPIVLAGIEIELSNKFDFSKALICKCLGFPLISINIEEYSLGDMNLEWAKRILTETTKSSQHGYRRNYIYIHRMLTTAYINIPKRLVEDTRHQFVIFSPRSRDFLRLIRQLKEALGISDVQATIALVQSKNEQLKLQIENAGNLAGESWREYNKFEYIQLSVNKPVSKSGPLYLFHLGVAALCNSTFESLVGYKYVVGMRHFTGDELVWYAEDWQHQKLVSKHHVAPKRLSEPVKEILSYVENSEA